MLIREENATFRTRSNAVIVEVLHNQELKYHGFIDCCWFCVHCRNYGSWSHNWELTSKGSRGGKGGPECVCDDRNNANVKLETNDGSKVTTGGIEMTTIKHAIPLLIDVQVPSWIAIPSMKKNPQVNLLEKPVQNLLGSHLGNRRRTFESPPQNQTPMTSTMMATDIRNDGDCLDSNSDIYPGASKFAT